MSLECLRRRRLLCLLEPEQRSVADEQPSARTTLDCECLWVVTQSKNRFSTSCPQELTRQQSSYALIDLQAGNSTTF